MTSDPEGAPPILKAMLRGGGGKIHESLKIAGLGWLINNRYEAADFEIGGFDVLGISESGGLTDSRVVIDAKASKADLYSHFQKKSMEDCDVEGKFSKYASLHYIISQRGCFPADAVHDPWGLLEVFEGRVEVTKEARARAYIGDPYKDLYTMAARTAHLLSVLVGSEETARRVQKVSSTLFLNKNEARKVIEDGKDVLVKQCMTFETLYGYNPLRKEYLSG